MQSRLDQVWKGMKWGAFIGAMSAYALGSQKNREVIFCSFDGCYMDGLHSTITNAANCHSASYFSPSMMNPYIQNPYEEGELIEIEQIQDWLFILSMTVTGAMLGGFSQLFSSRFVDLQGGDYLIDQGSYAISYIIKVDMPVEVPFISYNKHELTLRRINYQGDIPKPFIDSVNSAIMVEPVTLIPVDKDKREQAEVVDRSTYARLVKTKQLRCPQSRAEFNGFLPNRNLRDCIQNWVNDQVEKLDQSRIHKREMRSLYKKHLGLFHQKRCAPHSDMNINCQRRYEK